MIAVKFYCDIYADDGEQIKEKDFCFDSGEFNTRADLNKYKSKCGYAIGEPCAYWGEDVGILTNILIHEEI